MPKYLDQPFSPEHLRTIVYNSWSGIALSPDADTFIMPDGAMQISSVFSPLQSLPVEPVDACMLYYTPYKTKNDSYADKLVHAVRWLDNRSSRPSYNGNQLITSTLESVASYDSSLELPETAIDDSVLHGEIALQYTADCIDRLRPSAAWIRVLGAVGVGVVNAQQHETKDDEFDAELTLSLGISSLFVDQAGQVAEHIARNRHTARYFSSEYVDLLRSHQEVIEEIGEDARQSGLTSQEQIVVLRPYQTLVAYNPFMQRVALGKTTNQVVSMRDAA